MRKGDDASVSGTLEVVVGTKPGFSLHSSNSSKLSVENVVVEMYFPPSMRPEGVSTTTGDAGEFYFYLFYLQTELFMPYICSQLDSPLSLIYLTGDAVEDAEKALVWTVGRLGGGTLAVSLFYVPLIFCAILLTI